MAMRNLAVVFLGAALLMGGCSSSSDDTVTAPGGGGKGKKNHAPTLGSLPSLELDQGYGQHVVTLPAKDRDGDRLTYTARTANGKAAVSVAGGKLTIDEIADEAGDDTITVTVSDGAASAKASFDLTIHEATAVSFTVKGPHGLAYGLHARESYDWRTDWECADRGLPAWCGPGEYSIRPIIKAIGAGKEVWLTADPGEVDHQSTQPANLREGETYTLRIYAAAGFDPENPDCMTVDNTAGGAVYVYDVAYVVPANDPTNPVELQIESSLPDLTWVHTGTRYRSPFSMCYDTVSHITMMSIFDCPGADPDTAECLPGSIAPLPVVYNWSENNIPTEGDISIGEIGTTHYSPTTGEIYVLGAYDVDTDEFDGNVLMHEYVHLMEDKAGRSDSIGGSHALGDYLDPRVAWSEGLANALSVVVTQRVAFGYVYSDTSGVDNADVSYIDWAADNIDDADAYIDGRLADGSYSEASVTELLVDLFDYPFGAQGVTNDNMETDGGDDAVEIPLDDLLVIAFEQLPQQAALASVTGFLHLVAQQHADQAADIVALAAAENITGFGEWGDNETTMYTSVALGGSATGSSADTFGAITAGYPGNSLLNWAYFKNDTAVAGGCYAVTATPDAGADVVVSGYGGGIRNAGLANVAETIYLNSPANGGLAWAVGTMGSAGDFDVTVNATSSDHCE